jgi:large subunit ribosomal protein L32
LKSFAGRVGSGSIKEAPQIAALEVPMAVPYGRKSRSKSRMRRAANMKYSAKSYIGCSNCGAPKMSHYACGSCGAYAGRQARPRIEE